MAETERKGLELAALRGDLKLPTEDGWKEVGRVAGLYVYPVKSLTGQAVPSFTVTDSGGLHSILL